MQEQLIKRQHYVPRTYLKHFSNQKGDQFYIKALPIDNPQQTKIFEINTQNICLQRDIYTLPGKTVEEKMLLEKFYSDELEVHYNGLYSILKNPNKTHLSDKERELIISTVVTMFFRTTKTIKQYNDSKAEEYKQIFAICKQLGHDSFTDNGLTVSIKGKTLDSFLKEQNVEIQPSQVLTQLEVALKLIELRLKNNNIYLSNLVDEDCEFITSDNPVVLQNIHGNDIIPFDPTNIMKLPIDKKTMLFLMPNDDAVQKNLIVRNNVSGHFCKAEKLISNTEQFQVADRFILGDENSLNSFLTTKKIAETSLTNEEYKSMNGLEDIIRKGKEIGLF